MVEVMTGRGAVAQRFLQLQNSARREVIGFDKPPYFLDPKGPNEVELGRLRRGVRYRVIYERSALEVPGMIDLMRHYAAAGEEIRVRSSLPMKLAIGDGRLALIPLNLGEEGREGALAVHASSLLESLTLLFETLWERSVPVRFSRDGSVTKADEVGLSDEDVEILTLLASGMKDEAVARHMGMAVRTVRRRIGSLMDMLGASTRFQAGLHAARRDLV